MHLYMQHMHMKQKLGQVQKSLVLTVSFSSVQGRSRMIQSVSICLMQWLVSATCSTRLLVFDQLAMSDSPSCASKILRAPKRPHALNLQNTCRSCRTNHEIKRNYVMFFEWISSEITSYSHYVMTCHTALCICVLQWLSWTDSLHGHAWSLCAFGCGCALWRGLSTL